MEAQKQAIPFFKYQAIPIPSREQREELMAKGERDPYEAIADQLSEMSATGKGAAMLVVGDVIFVGGVAGFYVAEPTIALGRMAP